MIKQFLSRWLADDNATTFTKEEGDKLRKLIAQLDNNGTLVDKGILLNVVRKTIKGAKYLEAPPAPRPSQGGCF